MGDARSGSGSWRLELLGSVVRLVRGEAQWLPERRTAALLAWVALEGPIPRDRAAALLWPDREPARARGNLRQLLFRLRREADVLDGDPIELRPGVTIDLDDASADTESGVGDPTGGATFLAGHDFDDLGELAERIAAGRERARIRVRSLWAARVERHERQGDLPAAARVARDLLALDPVDEDAARTAMRLQLALGRSAEALAIFSRTRGALSRMLDVGPSPETVALAERAATAAASPLRGPPEPPGAGNAGNPIARRAEAGGWLADGAELLRTLAQGMEPGPQRGRVLVQLAWLEHQRGRHGEAQKAAESGLELLDEEEADSARIEAWFVLGSIARFRGDPARAAELWRQALERASQRPADAGRLALRLNLGMVEDSLGRVDEALAHYLAALPYAEAQGDTESTTILYNNIGHALAARGEPERARPLLLAAVRRAEEAGDRRLHAYALESLARCELARGEPEAARGFASQALAAARDWDDPALQAEAAVTFAEAEAVLGNARSAQNTARAALGLAQRHDYLPGAMRSAWILARSLGPDVPAARQAVRVLAADPRAPTETRDGALELAEAWGGAATPAEHAVDRDAAWAAVVEALVTPG